MMTDPIADMLTRIRNAYAAKHAQVVLPMSKIKGEIAKILKHENYISEFSMIEIDGFPQLKVVLRYDDAKPAIRHVERVSKPGQRMYVSKHDLPRVLSGYGIAILSTSQGLMTNKEARKQHIGGEVMCTVW